MSIPLVFINGWAMPEEVPIPFIKRLIGIDVTIINLSCIAIKHSDFTLKDIIQWLYQELPDTPFVLVGWSYGGLLACAYANAYPTKVKALVTLATNPCFSAKLDWRHAINSVTFDKFLTALKISPKKTLRQFSVLCSIGSKNKKQLNQYLNSVLMVSDNMTNMLTVLGLADIRKELTSINCPVIHCYGKEDALVPSDITESVKHLFKRHNTYVGPGGHCFFLDYPEPVIALLKSYCQGV
ncbi:MAG: alpha/beta fold hydrolase [Endozoicomonas sp. (ex Botrylloides leachii)]|nr:alpha/beta fold hydrolase [Endozoicomonas sp. (ex Botrylloides leachii)]